MTATLMKPTEIRTELENLGERLNGLREKDRTDETRTEMRGIVEEIGFLDYLYRIEQRKAEIDAESNGPKGGTAQRAQGPDNRSIGERFVDTDGYRSFAGNSGSGHYEAEVRTLVDSTGGVSYAADADNGPGLLRPIGTPFIPPQTVVRTRLFMRDVLDVVSTGLANVPYIKELNAEAYASAASGAQFVAEGGTKPEVGLSFQPADAPIRKIAAWIPATYEILQDAPTLRGYIDGRLRYMLALTEERAILNGNGTAPNIRGILQQSSIQTQAAITDDPFASIGKAFGKVEIVDGDPSFVAMNPGDYWATVVGRHANQFDGQSYSGGSPFNAPPAQVWGVPVVRTNAMTTLTALVGCRLGATILDREAAVIRVGDQHSTYFIENKVAVLAEERMGLAVHRPDWFVNTTIDLP